LSIFYNFICFWVSYIYGEVAVIFNLRNAIDYVTECPWSNSVVYLTCLFICIYRRVAISADHRWSCGWDRCHLYHRHSLCCIPQV